MLLDKESNIQYDWVLWTLRNSVRVRFRTNNAKLFERIQMEHRFRGIFIYETDSHPIS
jgi:hypothetical protein